MLHVTCYVTNVRVLLFQVSRGMRTERLQMQYKIHFIILQVITDQCSAFDLIKKIEVLAAGMEDCTGQLDYK